MGAYLLQACDDCGRPVHVHVVDGGSAVVYCVPCRLRGQVRDAAVQRFAKDLGGP